MDTSSVVPASVGHVNQKHNEDWVRKYEKATALLKVRTLCADHFLFMIQEADKALDAIFSGNLQLLALNKTSLGLFLANCMVQLREGPPAPITHTWETILWAVMYLVKFWRPEFRKCITIFQSKASKLWILRVFNDTEMCPNFRLRLELLFFFGMWPEEDLRSKRVGDQVAIGLVSTTSRLELHHVLPDEMHLSFVYSLTRALHNCFKSGQLVTIASAAIGQVKNLLVGPEVQCLARLVEVASQTVVQLVEWFQEGSLGASLIIEVIEIIFILFRLLLTGSPTKAAYECPGLVQTAAASFFTATSSIVNAATALQVQDAKSYRWLLTDMDDLFGTMAVQEEPQSVMAVMRRNHGQCFSAINQQAADSGYPLYHLPRPCEEQTDNCPEMYIDSVTQQVMEAPVLLKSSKMIVDESTLVHLLLVSPTDPFTRCPLYPGSYTRLPHLRDDIVVWRNRSLFDDITR
ncbi:E4 ubiquitin-protein ligase UFD2-like 7 [Homarus americanus]|uniref:E4 ubiquitin-protein ligase UFD2-like 7 n=1 Tax=Homarus americanus TaxID=6706 RepID=A0A8J5N3E5_HOMAM|nr:E4 ubiquitin-protein ligase UFD2-like 7 [Homarus americanus]